MEFSSAPARAFENDDNDDDKTDDADELDFDEEKAWSFEEPHSSECRATSSTWCKLFSRDSDQIN